MSDLAKKLRDEAAILPHELYSVLNPVLIEAADEIERLRAALNDCVALITGQASGEAQREGIIRESIAILGKHYAGPVVEQKGDRS